MHHQPPDGMLADDMPVLVRFLPTPEEERGVGFAEGTPALTESDRRVIARARELAALRTTAAVCERFAGWGNDPAPAYAEAFGTARWLLEELAAIAERLGGAR